MATRVPALIQLSDPRVAAQLVIILNQVSQLDVHINKHDIVIDDNKNHVSFRIFGEILAGDNKLSENQKGNKFKFGSDF